LEQPNNKQVHRQQTQPLKLSCLY